MFSTTAITLRALSRAPRQVRCPAARRRYATEYDQRTKETLKTSSRLTWITTAAALGAGALYYTTSSAPKESTTTTTTTTTSSQTSTSDPDHNKPGYRRAAEYAEDVPKPVEDRHGDTVEKHSIAARKNQNKVREGKFSGKEFDNHELKHSPGNPGGDFEKRE